MASFGWTTRRVLIVVRTYPVPATKGIEVSCTAAITSEHEWMRLFPVPYRFLDEDKRFKKYQWIDVAVRRARNDSRPESFNLNDGSIKIVGSVPPRNGWRARKDFLLPLQRASLCQIERERAENSFPTLGFFRPARINRLAIDAADPPDWTPHQRALLSRQLLPFGSGPKAELEKVPFDFRYEFQCDDSECNGHKLMCTDWEMGQSYRSWRRTYGAGWEQKFREKYEQQMIERFDTCFYVGTLHQYPSSWIIVGLFYPPKPAVGDLFDA
jgi:hypothetical protein